MTAQIINIRDHAPVQGLSYHRDEPATITKLPKARSVYSCPNCSQFRGQVDVCGNCGHDYVKRIKIQCD